MMLLGFATLGKQNVNCTSLYIWYTALRKYFPDFITFSCSCFGLKLRLTDNIIMIYGHKCIQDKNKCFTEMKFFIGSKNVHSPHSKETPVNNNVQTLD